MARKRSRQDKSRPPLTSLELAVMDTIWELGECTSSQIVETFRRKRPLAPTTIRTVLTSLRKKGYITPVPTIERALRLRPAVPRETVARRSLRELLASLFEDSPRQAIACLLDHTDLSDDELEDIRRLVEQRKRKG